MSCSSGALDLFVGVRQPFIGARDQGIVGFDLFGFRRGVHWRFPFPSNVIRRWRSTIASPGIGLATAGGAAALLFGSIQPAGRAHAIHTAQVRSREGARCE